jgi:hypothetical protein
MLLQLCQLLVLTAAGLLAEESSDLVQKLHAEAQQILASPAAEQDLIRLVQIDLSLSDEKGSGQPRNLSRDPANPRRFRKRNCHGTCSRDL